MRKTCHLLVVAAALATSSAAALAAANDGFEPPALDAPTNWLAWVLGIVFIIGVIIVGFKNARRTHLD